MYYSKVPKFLFLRTNDNVLIVSTIYICYVIVSIYVMHKYFFHFVDFQLKIQYPLKTSQKLYRDYFHYS